MSGALDCFPKAFPRQHKDAWEGVHSPHAAHTNPTNMRRTPAQPTRAWVWYRRSVSKPKLSMTGRKAWREAERRGTHIGSFRGRHWAGLALLNVPAAATMHNGPSWAAVKNTHLDNEDGGAGLRHICRHVAAPLGQHSIDGGDAVCMRRQAGK